ncbi:hypothetical protein [Myxococcus stipitatus]|uniref:hypothetical protein n=1 Tax=Myxococcus stipitatus TaxID=83455 RepID=UPI0002F7FFA6|nr:hypothetical protein [Myxococcus stipitatus]
MFHVELEQGREALSKAGNWSAKNWMWRSTWNMEAAYELAHVMVMLRHEHGPDGVPRGTSEAVFTALRRLLEPRGGGRRVFHVEPKKVREEAFLLKDATANFWPRRSTWNR